MKTESKESLVSNSGPEDEENAGQKNFHINAPDEYILTETEKKFLLAAERGDCATVKWIIEENAETPKEFSIDCVDPLNRSALISAIENENFDLITLLLEEGIQVKDALLHAISEEYIEAVEELLIWEEKTHVQGKPYSWEAVDRSKSNFTPDITPLILAAHRNNYEILKVLLDRGASLPMPHDVKCGCDECVVSQETDSLRHSQSRINAYRALSSSSLIALSSIDPVLTAFELSWELKRLQRMESEFRAEYTEMRLNVQEFSTSLLDYARTSSELEVMLNYNHEVTPDVWMPGDRQTLERLKLAIKYKQKNFIAHPNVQQLLGAIWYDGLPGFRRKTMPQQLIDVAKLACMFPVYSMNYIMAPYSDMGKFMRKPFVKFISHSASYAFFLMLLGAASQRVEYLALELIGLPWMLEILKDWKERERGSFPGPIECAIMMYITSLIFAEIKTLYSCGLWDYISDLWNIVDFISNCFYVTWIFCRATAWIIVHRDAWYRDINPYFPREHWHLFDPMLLSEGAFAAGMIFSFLKLVHIFSINPHLGPLQVSLGRMIIDIIKFFFIYTLVLFAFGCGLNQLLWYYADLEKRKCFHFHPDVADFDDNEKECTIWRRFANLFETSQSLFWASFGLVDLVSFDLAGIKGFTRFWALLMFGSYSVINIIVLLNMLIAMMSNSYQIISERADVEWKFARSQLWMSYFEEGDTLPPPFNLCPTVKMLGKTLGKGKKRTRSLIRRSMEKARTLHEKVMKLLVRRYITAEQRKRDDFGITEDDIIEVRQDISSLRYELLDIFNQNNMRVPDIEKKTGGAGTKKGKVMERRIMKDFQIGIVETIKNEIKTGATDVFKSIANVVGKKGEDGDKKDWNAIVRKNTLHRDPIGSTKSSMIRRSQRSLRRKMIEDANAGLRIDTDKLVEFNPKLSDVPQGTRVAYVKFMSKAVSKREQLEHISEKAGVESTSAGANKDQAGTSKSSIKKGNESQKTQAPGVPIAAVIKSKPGDKGADQSKTSIKKPEAPGAKPAAAGAAAEANKKAPTGAPPSTDAKAKAPAKPDSAPPSKPADSKPEAGAAKSEPANKPDAAPAGTKPDSAPPASKPDSAPPASKPDSAASKPDAAPPASKPAAKGPESKPATDSGAEGGAAGGSTDQKAGAGGKTGEAKDDKKSDSKPADADKKPAEGAAAKPGDKPAGAAGDKKPDPKDKKPPPKSKPGQSSAAAGGDRGKSTVTGRMISGWL